MKPVLETWTREYITQGDLVLSHHDHFWWCVIGKDPETKTLFMSPVWNDHKISSQLHWEYAVISGRIDFFPRVLQALEWV